MIAAGCVVTVTQVSFSQEPLSHVGQQGRGAQLKGRPIWCGSVALTTAATLDWGGGGVGGAGGAVLAEMDWLPW